MILFASVVARTNQSHKADERTLAVGQERFALTSASYPVRLISATTPTIGQPLRVLRSPGLKVNRFPQRISPPGQNFCAKVLLITATRGLSRGRPVRRRRGQQGRNSMVRK